MTQAMILLAQDPIPTRYSLLSRLQDWEDQDSWRDFFDTYWRLIYSAALKAGLTDSEAQDVVQETIFSVAKDLGKFKRDRKLGSFKGWLYNVIRWRIGDQLRKRTNAAKKETQTSDLAAGESFTVEVADPNTEWDGVWEQEWQENLLASAMERVRCKVKEEHYQMFDLYAIKGWPVKKVAQSLGVHVGSVYLAKHRVSALIKLEVLRLKQKWH